MEAQKNTTAFREAMAVDWKIIPEFFITSAERKNGKTELLGLIEEIIFDNF